MTQRLLILFALSMCAACLSPDDVSSGDVWDTTETPSASTTDDPPVTEVVEDPPGVEDPPSCFREPKNHRAAPVTCDDVRSEHINPPDLPVDGEYVRCDSHDDCVEGDNGRCIGNGRDGWYCSYDVCFEDSGCGEGEVCGCGLGFRGDHNVCLARGNCQTNADCGDAGYCSPSFGDCGNYDGVIGYFCHTCEDECVDDADCGGNGQPYTPYCAYHQSAGRWMCSTNECAG